MKKIIIIIFCLLTLFIFNIKYYQAEEESLKDLYIELNDNPDLNIDGYDIIDNNLDARKIGTYIITYRNQSTNLELNRRVIVTTSINKGIIQEKKIDELDILLDDIRMIKIINNGYLILGTYHNNYQLYQVINQKITKYNLIDLNIGSIVDLAYDEECDNVYLLGNNGNSDLDLIIYQIVIKTTLMKKRIINLDNNQTASNITYSANYLYLTYMEDSIQHVMKITTNNFQIIGDESLGYKGGLIRSIFSFKNHIYIISTSYSSYFETNLIILNNDLEIINKERLVGDWYPLVNELILNDQFYILLSNADYNNQRIIHTLYQYQNDKLETKDIFYGNYNEKICGMSFNKELTVLKKNQNDIKLRIYTRNSDVIEQSIISNNHNYFMINDLIIEDEINSNIINIYDYDYLIVKSYGFTNSKDNFTPFVYNHFNELPYDYSKCNLNINYEMFGDYDLRYYYNTKYFDYILNKKIKVALKCKLVDKGIYDKIKLDYNGIIMVNEKEVEKGTIISEAGNYEIKIIGKDTIKKYSITIVDLGYEKNTNNNLNYELNHQLNNEELKIILSHNTINNNYNKDFKSNLWFILIPATTIVLSLSMYFTIGKRYL